MEAESRLKDIIEHGNIVCVSGDGLPYVKITYAELKDAHRLHRLLVHAKAATVSPSVTIESVRGELSGETYERVNG